MTGIEFVETALSIGFLIVAGVTAWLGYKRYRKSLDNEWRQKDALGFLKAHTPGGGILGP